MFLVALQNCNQIQLLVGFGIPNPILAGLDTSVFLLGHSPLPPCLACIYFMAKVSQEILHPYRPPTAFPHFPAHQDGPLSSLEEVISENDTEELLEKKTS